MTWFDKIPDEYQEHLPGPGPTHKETLKGVAKRGFEEGTEPFLKVGEGIKDSLRRIYKVAAQPMGAAEPIKPRPFEEAPIEFLGSLAAYVVAMPIKMVKEVIEGGERALKGVELLRGGPRGELGEWTPEQMAVEREALNLTIGAMVGGAPGAGTGVANIGRKDALKMLAKEFRGMRRGISEPSQLETAKLFSRWLAKEPTSIPLKAPTEPMKKGFRTITKGMRDIPQPVLDIVKEVGLAPMERTDIAGRYMPKRARVEYQITEHLPKETIPHEFLHGVQIAKMGKRAKGVPSAVLEAHAYEFEGLFMKAMEALPAGKRITGETFNRLYKESLGAMTEKYGTDFSKYKMREIVSKAHMERNWERLVREGELKSIAPAKVGEIVELPQGKARFDGIQEGFGTVPQTYMYTFQEGPVKGGSFVSRSQRPADVAAAGQKITDLWMKYAKKKGGGS